jgi:hypothetical protein
MRAPFTLHRSHARADIQPLADSLHVLTMLENPLRWRARYRNYWMFERHVEQSGAILYTCEIAFGEREFEITRAGNPRHLQLRASSELWRKENALNLLAARLPADAKYLAWIDADVQFARPDWAQETLHLLQHYDVIQMFSHVQNIGPRYESLNSRRSFLWNYVENRSAPHSGDFARPRPASAGSDYCYGGSGGGGKWNHTGFAWACRKSAFDHLGGLIDWAIIGSADYHMAAALVGNVGISLNPLFPPRYRQLCERWEDRAVKYVLRNPSGGVGYMPGTILHHFHGSTVNRAYNQRWKLLVRTNFDPDLDLKRDWQGLWQLTDHNPELRDGLRAYARLRDEDSSDTRSMI